MGGLGSVAEKGLGLNTKNRLYYQIIVILHAKSFPYPIQSHAQKWRWISWLMTFMRLSKDPSSVDYLSGGRKDISLYTILSFPHSANADAEIHNCKTACKTFQGPGEKSVEKFPLQVVQYPVFCRRIQECYQWTLLPKSDGVILLKWFNEPGHF